MFFTFVVLLVSIGVYLFINKSYAADDLLEKAFEPAITHETIINLGAGKNAVGNEVFRGTTTITLNNHQCFVENDRISSDDLQIQKANL